jgi:hypothetical protein
MNAVSFKLKGKLFGPTRCAFIFAIVAIIALVGPSIFKRDDSTLIVTAHARLKTLL